MRKVAVIALALLAMFVYIITPLALAAPNYVDASLNDEEPAEVTGGTISGRVTTGNYGAYDCVVVFTPIEGESNPYTYEIDSASNGAYITDVLPSGVYSAYAESHTTNERRTYASNITIEDGVNVEGIDFNFERSYVLTGQVRNVDLFLNDVTVSIYATGNPSEITYTHTNEFGRYQFTGLSEGTYTLLFQKDGYKDVSTRITIGVDAPYFNTQMYKSGLPGINGFIPGYDFQHSMMIVGIVGIIVMIAFALMIWAHITKHPSLILEDEEDSVN